VIQNPTRRAFTILELLAVVGVIGVLLAILLPALSGARVSAGRTVMLSNLRGIGVIFEAYTQVYDNYYPFHNAADWYVLHPPDEMEGVMLNDGRPWGMRVWWGSAFHHVAPWREHYRSWLNIGREVNERAPWIGLPNQPTSGIVSYYYSTSFMARPETWPAPGDRVPGDGFQFQAGVRAAEVSSPSGKALCFDSDRAYLQRAAREDDPRGVLGVDGAVSLRHDRDAVAPVQNVLDDRSPAVYHDAPGGVRGRDFR